MALPAFRFLLIVFAALQLSGTDVLGAEVSPAVLKAKKEADARGYTALGYVVPARTFITMFDGSWPELPTCQLHGGKTLS